MNQEIAASKAPASSRPLRVTRVGVVDSVCGSKTVRVVLERLVKAPMYGKYLRRRTKLAVHDPAGQAKVGDTVEVAECRPISRTKSWRLVRVVRPAKSA